jgi:DNA repair protein SbcC/Rad50
MIERVMLHNFISHSDTDLPLGQGVTVFVGRNGAGKSSIIDAVTYAMYGEHTRGPNDNLVKRGTTMGSATVEFSVSGREFLVERKLNKSGQLEGSVLKERVNGLMRQLAAGERKQFGESLSEEVGKILGLDYKRMRVAAIVQQGELDSIVVDFSPKQFKELVNSLIGIDQLEVAYQNMLGVTNSFRSHIRDLYGFDDTNLQAIKNTLSEKEASIESLRVSQKESEILLNEFKKLESSLDASIQKMEPLRDKVNLLQSSVDNLLKYVRDRKDELEGELIELERVVAQSKKYVPIVANERAAKSELRGVKRTLKLLDGSIVKTSSTKAQFESMRKRPDELLRLVTKAKDCLLLIKKETGAKEKLEEVQRRLKALETKGLVLTRELGKLQSQQETAERLVFKDNKCPVCGSHVEKINPIFDSDAISKHINEHETESKRIELERRTLEREEEVLRERAASVDKAVGYLSDNKISNARDVEKLDSDRSELVKRISGLPELEETLRKAKATKKTLGEKERSLGESLSQISIAKSYLKEHSTSTKSALDRVSRRRDALKKSVEGIPEITEQRSAGETVLSVRIESPEHPGTFLSTRDLKELTGLAVDRHSRGLLSQISALAGEASKFNGKEYEEKTSQLGKLRSETLPDQSAKWQLYGSQITQGVNETQKLTKALGEVERAEEFMAVLTKIRDKVFYRDGPVPSSLRSWALKHIAAKASEYARLFEIGISSIELREKARDISIECHGPRGTVDTSSLSGGEKVAIALALRFGMAYVMGGYKLDFVVLDEPTIHLDEERKASMVDIISRLGTEESPLKQVIIITHDAEIFENAEVDCVFKFETTPEGTKVKLEA